MTAFAVPLILAAALAIPAEVPPTETTPPPRTEAPNTDDCPNALTPPEPRTTSEVPAPGQALPAALPATPVEFCGVSTVEGFQVPDDVLASSFLVADIDTGEILAQKDPHGRYRPASIVKGLLALVTVQELPLDHVATASLESASQEGSAVGIGEGGHYTVLELLQGLMMGSGNDAAHVLAQELGGDEATLAKISDLTTELGTSDTRAASYSGLDAPGMSTSAFDMGLIYRSIYADPILAEIMRTDMVHFPGYGDVPGYELWNDNGLFMNDEHGIGGKTGYTDDANHTFVGAMDRDGRRLMAIILDTTRDAGPAWQQAQRLLHAAYDVPATTRPLAYLEPVKAEETTTAAAPLPAKLPEASASPEPSGSADRLGPIAGVGGVVLLLLIAALLIARRWRWS